MDLLAPVSTKQLTSIPPPNFAFKYNPSSHMLTLGPMVKSAEVWPPTSAVSLLKIPSHSCQMEAETYTYHSLSCSDLSYHKTHK